LDSTLPIWKNNSLEVCSLSLGVLCACVGGTPFKTTSPTTTTMVVDDDNSIVGASSTVPPIRLYSDNVLRVGGTLGNREQTTATCKNMQEFTTLGCSDAFMLIGYYGEGNGEIKNPINPNDHNQAFSDIAPIHGPDNVLIADSWRDLWSDDGNVRIQRSLSQSLANAHVMSSSSATWWSGVDNRGIASLSASCFGYDAVISKEGKTGRQKGSSWTNVHGQGLTGVASQTFARWVSEAETSCSLARRVVCVCI